MADLTRPHSTAFVTGAGGQDGWLLTRRLLANGATVHACSRGAAEVFDGMEGDAHHVTCDRRHPESLFEAIRRVRPDEFFHLAGVSSVARSFADPDEAWQTNATFANAVDYTSRGQGLARTARRRCGRDCGDREE